MRYNSIADIYSAKAKFRENFQAVIAGISDDEAAAMPDGEKWSIQHVVEHLSMVETGIARICSRMIETAKAEGKTSDGSFVLSPQFRESISRLASGDTKVEAPDRVQPTGEVMLADSVAKLAAATAAIETLRDELQSIDASGQTFPHPYFGPLTAAEWIVVAGLHEGRHTRQIEHILSKLRQ